MKTFCFAARSRSWTTRHLRHALNAANAGFPGPGSRRPGRAGHPYPSPSQRSEALSPTRTFLFNPHPSPATATPFISLSVLPPASGLDTRE